MIKENFLKIFGKNSVQQKELNKEFLELLLAASNADTVKVPAMLQTSGGLTEEDALGRLEKYGKNAVVQEKQQSWYGMLLGNFKNPFILVLIVIGMVSYLTGDIKTTIVVAVMVGLSVIMRFLQEYRSSKAAEKLKSMVRTTATVLRRLEEPDESGTVKPVSKWVEVPFENIVPGDLVHLSAGDMVPADMRLVRAKDLFVSQSALTGESMPVEKYSAPYNHDEKKPSVDKNPLERNNLCFLGTNIISGSGAGVVVATGNQTFFGSMAKGIIGHRSLTSFDKGINSVTMVLVSFMLTMVPLVFVINGIVKGDWQEAFLFSIAVAVGLTPEMLPMVVTANLAKGAVALSRQKVIVKRLNAIQNFGAMDILCTDKTGTLTQDRIILEKYLDINGDEDMRVLEYAYINSYYQTGLKNLLDRAVLEHAEYKQQLRLPENYIKVDEIPFDFARRRMSVVVEKERHHLLICKGAVEEVMGICTMAESKGSKQELTGELRFEITELMKNLNEDGLRIVAVAYKLTEPIGRPYSSVEDEKDMVLAGFVAFLDPPKETAAPAIAALNAHGVQVRILTGDNDIITRRVCKEVGLQVENIALGSDIEHLSDEELADLAKRTIVFAKLAPLQKARIIKALKSKGYTVGYLGDGINDAPALRDADVGISVDSATDIARESADIILLEKSLLVLEEGVLKGREVFGNIMKYIKMTASSNFGNVFSILTASAFLPFLPMLPIHLLIQNLLYDISQLSLPWDKMDREFLVKPRKWEATGIVRFMLFIGPISSLFDITTFALLWYVFQANTLSVQSLFQSGWFIEGLLSQTLIVHMIRTQKIPFIQSTATAPVLLLTGSIVVAGIYLPFSSISASVKMQHLPVTFFPWLAVILLTYLVLTQIVKKWYVRKFNRWL